MVTNQQLYLAIGIPMLFNATLIGLFAVHLNTRFNDMRDLWRAELRRVKKCSTHACATSKNAASSQPRAI